MADLQVQNSQPQGEITSVGTLGNQQSLSSPPTPNVTDTPPKNNVPTGNEQLDPQVVTLAKAIRKVETNGNYSAVNPDSGGVSVGAYQWHGANQAAAMQHFKTEAVAEGLNPNDFSPTNQDLVAYTKMKNLKDQGYHAGEIAALWNGAKIVNGRPVPINPAYVQKVQKAVSEVSGTNGYVTPPPLPAAATATPQQTQDSSGSQDTNQPNNQPMSAGQDVGNFALGVAKSVPQTLVGLGKLGESALDQTFGRVANAVSGKGFSAQNFNPNEQTNQSNIDNSIKANNTAQKAGVVAGDIGQFFIPGGAEEAGANIASKAAELLDLGPNAIKTIELGGRGLVSGVENTALGKAQGQTNGQALATGGISAVAPFAGQAVKGITGLLPDLLGGQGSKAALAVKAANPELYEDIASGARTPGSLASDITSAADQYEKTGKASLQAMKDSLPDVAMPKTNIQGQIQKIIDSVSGSNLSVEDERTLNKLQDYVSKNVGNNTTSKGILDLRTGIDNGGYYKDGSSAYSNSNKVVQQVRQLLNNTVIDRMSNYDSEYGTNYADQVKQGLASASDRINFMDHFRSNLIGNNTENNVEQTTNKIRSLISKSSDPGLAENTKALLADFEKRIGQPGKFTNELQTANAVKALDGFKGRVGGKLAKTALGGGLMGELIKNFMGNH